MREILFRGKRIDNGEWVCSGDLIHFNEENECYIPATNGKCQIALDEADNIIGMKETQIYKVLPETVGQYTGLTDKNGNKIFEGDIINFKTTAYHFKNCRIEYRSYYGRYCAINNEGCEYPMDKTFEYEIVGNIHDNPELMKGEEKCRS